MDIRIAVEIQHRNRAQSKPQYGFDYERKGTEDFGPGTAYGFRDY